MSLPANHANKTNKNFFYSGPFALFAGKFSSRPTRAAISLNSAKGFSSFTRKMIRRAFRTQSYFASTASSSARLNLKTFPQEPFGTVTVVRFADGFFRGRDADAMPFKF